MDDCIDSLGDARVFYTLDANACYWQIRVAKKDREKASFICHAGTYQFIRMPFGLVNAPATFQRGMDVILSTVKWKFCLVYLDDIIIYSPSHEQHLKDLD
jgi:Reverse transcriptase (RNA-dependent DNA polymerase)